MRGYSLRRCAFSDYCGRPSGQKRSRSGDPFRRCNTRLKRIASSVGSHHINISQQRRLASLEPVRIDEAAVKKDAAEEDATSTAANPWGSYRRYRNV